MKGCLIGIIAAFAGILTSWAHAADTYRIDPRHTFPFYEISHFGWSTQRGRFERVTGTITLDRTAKTGSVDITIDVSSVSTGVPKLDTHLKHEHFFHVSEYPEMTFRSTKVHFAGDEPAAVEGKLTLRGVTRSVTLAISTFHCAPNPYVKKEACGADASTTIRRSDFGMTYGLPGIGDEVSLLISVEAHKDSP